MLLRRFGVAAPVAPFGIRLLQPVKTLLAAGVKQVLQPGGTAPPADPTEQHFYAEHAAAATGDAQANANITAAGFSRDSALSGANYQTYAKDGKAIVAYRSTDVRRPQDLLADAHIATGTEAHSRRFKQAQAVAQQALGKYGQGNVTFTGHSLGAAQAVHVAERTGARAVAYSTPDFKTPGLLSFLGLKRQGNVTSYRVRTDPIAVGARLGGARVHDVKQTVAGNPHALGNFRGDFSTAVHRWGSSPA